MSPILIFLLAGLATYGLRSALVVGNRLITPGGWIEQRVVFVGPSVLAALIVSSLFLSAEGPTMGSAAEIIAVGVALLVVLRTDNVGLALVVGLPVFWLATALGIG